MVGWRFEPDDLVLVEGSPLSAAAIAWHGSTLPAAATERANRPAIPLFRIERAALPVRPSTVVPPAVNAVVTEPDTAISVPETLSARFPDTCSPAITMAPFVTAMRK